LKTAHLFPAFVTEYLGIETKVIGKDLMHNKLEKASASLDCNLTDFDIVNHNYLDDPLKSQYITYILSCCVSDMLHHKDKIPDLVSVFSMGIYAALYHCCSINFETGLRMIQSAYFSIENNLPEQSMGMCVIGGLSFDDVNGIMRSHVDKVNIINQNSEFSFILSGHRYALLKIIDNAKADGAMQTRMLPVEHPYHSPLLKKASEDFALQIKEMEVNNSIYPLLSALNQRVINKRSDIIHELVSNLYQPFHWWTTFNFMLSQKVDIFIECGAGESLYKTGKFIHGEFKVINLKRLANYLNRELEDC
jgi:[acyl-carrier-protein] S-malonyltransferase